MLRIRDNVLNKFLSLEVPPEYKKSKIISDTYGTKRLHFEIGYRNVCANQSIYYGYICSNCTNPIKIVHQVRQKYIERGPVTDSNSLCKA